MNDQIKMQLSAFVDGELSDAESELLVRRISRDAGLRDQIAEYQAIGRVMRGEYSVRLDGLLDRVNANLESDIELVTAAPARRISVFRPLVGVATAAAVAMVALVGYGQLSVDAEPTIANDGYTVPSPDMQEYYRLHGEQASGFNTRVVNLQLREEALDDPKAEDPENPETPDDADEADQDAIEQQQPTQDVTIEP